MPSVESFKIGTSGWMYRHWIGVFYPPELKEREWFGYYSRFFDTVEINSSFDRLPSEKTFKGWAGKAPGGFLYAVKAWRRITHLKKLRNAGGDLKLFLSRARLLSDKLGPILFQTPPGLKVDVPLLQDFLALLPNDLSFVFEFRHRSWFIDEVFDALRRKGAGFCIMDHPYIPCPRAVTSDTVYVRMHGKGHLYQGLYSRGDLEELADFLFSAAEEGALAYVYFNNDFGGNAVRNALELREIIEGRLIHGG